MSNYRNNDPQRLADIFKALSNPNRLSIFMHLLQNVSQCSNAEDHTCEDQICSCVGELGKDLGIAPSTVSHHLKELHNAGLVKMKRRGKSVDCWVDHETVDAISDFLKQKVLV